jgi:hypothetical protein
MLNVPSKLSAITFLKAFPPFALRMALLTWDLFFIDKQKGYIFMQFLFAASVIMNIALAFYCGTLTGIMSELRGYDRELENILAE